MKPANAPRTTDCESPAPVVPAGPEPARDPRWRALEEWEAVQVLCESLAGAGTVRWRALWPLALPPPECGQL